MASKQSGHLVEYILLLALIQNARIDIVLTYLPRHLFAEYKLYDPPEFYLRYQFTFINCNFKSSISILSVNVVICETCVQSADFVIE
jgi:hypothetical protein